MTNIWVRCRIPYTRIPLVCMNQVEVISFLDGCPNTNASSCLLFTRPLSCVLSLSYLSRIQQHRNEQKGQHTSMLLFEHDMHCEVDRDKLIIYILAYGLFKAIKCVNVGVLLLSCLLPLLFHYITHWNCFKWLTLVFCINLHHHNLTVQFNNSLESHYSTYNSMGHPLEAIGTIKYIPVDSWIDFGSVQMSDQGQYAAVFTIRHIA